MKQQIYNTALYLRLSRDDNEAGGGQCEPEQVKIHNRDS